MTRRRRFLPLGFAAAFAIAGGTAWAVSEGGDRHPVGPAPTSGVLAQGTAPSGNDYVISRIEPGELGMDPTEMFCTEIKTPVSRTQGCELIPDQFGEATAQPVRPSLALLGADRFITALAPTGAKAMEVGVEGQAKTTASQSFDVGVAGELLVVVVSGPPVISRDPSTSRDYKVRLLGEHGETINETTKKDPE